MIKTLTTLLAAITMLLAVNSHAADNTDASGQYVAGTDYQVLEKPVRTSDPKRIEATEVFWYGCSHCYKFEPTVAAWHKTLAEDVVFVRSPAVWHPNMALHARAYYTAQVLGVLDTMHLVIFEAMNLKKNALGSEDAIADLFATHGTNREEFSKVFNSFGVTSAVKQAEARQRSYKIEGTPEMIVNGKYRITGRMGGSYTRMMKVVDHLIEVERNKLAASTNAS